MVASAARNPTHPSRAPGGVLREDICADCQGSGDIWVLDRQAGAIRITCSCGAEQAPDGGLHRLALMTCHGIAVGITILVVVFIL